MYATHFLLSFVICEKLQLQLNLNLYSLLDAILGWEDEHKSRQPRFCACNIIALRIFQKTCFAAWQSRNVTLHFTAVQLYSSLCPQLSSLAVS